MNRKNSNSPSTRKPSRPLGLGRFVIARRRKDGTHRVLFELPPRLRPSGWSPTTPMPITGARKGDLSDPSEVARIRADAAELYQDYLRDRGMAPDPLKGERSFRRLIAEWRRSQRFKACRPVSQKGYLWLAGQVQAWADAQARRPDPTTMRRADFEGILSAFDDRPGARYHIRKALRLVMDQAVALGWRTDNPVHGIVVGKPATKVSIWEQADVDAYAEAAQRAGQPDIAAIILTEWEIGQRLTDVIRFRRGVEYEPAEGAFRFRQSKTSQYVTIPVSARLRAIVGASGREGSPYLFHDAATGRPFRDQQRLSHAFEAVRALVMKGGARYLLLRALRHSCVVALARCGCTIPEIASITGHKLSTVTTVLESYLPSDQEVAWNAQRKRGLL